MAGISHNCKTGDVPAFGDCVGGASKALCGLTEAAGQVRRYPLCPFNVIICSQPLYIFTSEHFLYVCINHTCFLMCL